MFAVIVIPDFALQAALRHEPELQNQPVALVDSDPDQKKIIQASAAAKSFGVMEAQTPAQAMARCGSLLIKVRSPALEKSAAEILLQTAYAFSPNLEMTGAGVCTVDLRGLGLNSESARRQWGEKIVRIFSPLHLAVRVGIAITPGLASLAASAASPVSVIEKPEQFVARMPVAALSPPPDLAEILERWGIRQVGELLALGRDQLAERLGPPVLRLFDAVSPDSIRPLKLAAPSVEYAEEMEFEHEIETAEPLLFVLRRFAEQLAKRLEAPGFVVAEFKLRLGLANGAFYERTLKVPAPTGRVEILFRMLQTHLETVRTDAAIVSLRLLATPARPEAHQFGLFESTLRDPNQFAETLARLSALCGPECVGTPQPLATHRPDAFQMRAPEFDSPADDEKPGETPTGPALRRFRPPRGLYVEFRDGKPALLNGPRLNGAVHRSTGPFVASGDWWDRDHWAREEWDVEMRDGTLLRLFRTRDGCYVEGVYD